MNYTKVLEIFNDINGQIDELIDEFYTRIEAAGYDKEMFCPPIGRGTSLLAVVDEPSEGAVFDFEDETSRFYTLTVDGQEVKEAVDK